MSPALNFCLIFRIIRYDDEAVVAVVTDDGARIAPLIEATTAVAASATTTVAASAAAAMAGYVSLWNWAFWTSATHHRSVLRFASQLLVLALVQLLCCCLRLTRAPERKGWVAFVRLLFFELSYV